MIKLTQTNGREIRFNYMDIDTIEKFPNYYFVKTEHGNFYVKEDPEVVKAEMDKAREESNRAYIISERKFWSDLKEVEAQPVVDMSTSI